VGFCGAGEKVRIALVSLHQWEEPCLVGAKGAGTVFFSYCNLRCVYCQNHAISHGGQGVEVTTERLAEIFLEQQARGAATLDLVTPTHYVPQIIAALDIAKARGLTLPVVYNSSAYENVETIEALRGYVDVYLPDMKYMSAASGGEYSAAADYFAAASAAITRMVEQVGPVQFAADGQLRRGVLVRHMVLPGHRHESMDIVKWLWETFGKTVQVSLMNQYTPMYKAAEHKPLNRRLTTFEYDSVVDYALQLGMENAYIQERRSASAEFVPDFNGAGVAK
jgi:putative pyruvate formate lyase activating enzyme